MNPKNRPFSKNPKFLNWPVQPYARFIVLILSQGVKGYNNTCLCAYLAYLNDNNTSKTKKVTSGQKYPMAEMTPNSEALYS